MSCAQTFADYALRSIGIGARGLPRTDFDLCHQFVLIGSGLIWNLYFGILALAVGFFLATALALAKASDNPWLRRPAEAFIFVFRGSPLFIQFFLAYEALVMLPRAGIEVFGFTGSFLSVSIDLPTDALEGLTRNHIIRLETTLAVERPLPVYARLNVGHGPNIDEILQHLRGMEAGLQSQQVVEFDLAYTEMNERRLEKIWLDLIFEAPQMNAVRIRDLFLSRHLRADV